MCVTLRCDLRLEFQATGGSGDRADFAALGYELAEQAAEKVIYFVILLFAQNNKMAERLFPQPVKATHKMKNLRKKSGKDRFSAHRHYWLYAFVSGCEDRIGKSACATANN
jgi:hypothetical protein